MIVILLVIAYIIIKHVKFKETKEKNSNYYDVLVDKYIKNEINDEEFLKRRNTLKRKR